MDDALAQERITGQVVLSPEIYLVYTLFQRLPDSIISISSGTSRRKRTRSIRGNWKLKYSCRMVWVSVTALRYASDALDIRARISSSCRWIYIVRPLNSCPHDHAARRQTMKR